MVTPTTFTDVAVDSLLIAGVGVVPGWSVEVATGAAFAGGTTNAHGDESGTGNPATLYTVTGVVEVHFFGVCNTNLAGASATLEVGVAGNTAVLIAQSTATDIDAGEVWLATSPGVTAIALTANSTIVNDVDIIETTGTADITAGQIDYYCIWRPLSAGATVVAA